MYKQIAVLLLTSSLAAIASIGSNFAAQAATPDTAPTELKNAIAAVDTAANKRDLEAVMQFYPQNFSYSEGLTKDKLRVSLENLWQRYPNLQYRTELTNWERQGNNYIAKTVTYIQGAQGNKESDFKLNAEVVANQTYQYQDGKWLISQQDIISEKSSLNSGEKPPTVEMRLPQKIGVGRQYSLDAIVTEPLGNNLLLGTAIDEAVTPENYLKDTTVDLEPLRSGGVFRIGQAPYNEGDRWISVVLVRENGITITSQRLKVSKSEVGNQYRSLPESGTVPSRVRPDPNQRQTL